MDLNDCNKTNEVQTTLATTRCLIDSTDIDDINASGNINDLSENSLSTSGTSTSVHVELIPNRLNLYEKGNSNNDTELKSIENNEDDPLVGVTSQTLTKSDHSNRLVSNTPISSNQLDPVIRSDALGESVSIDNLDEPTRSTSVQVRSNPGESKRVRFKKNIVTLNSYIEDHNQENSTQDAAHEITISESSPMQSDLQRVGKTTTNQFSDITNQSIRKISDVNDDLNLEQIELNETSACLDDYDGNLEAIGNSFNSFEEEIETKTINKHTSNLRKASYVGRIYNRLTNINLLRNNSDELYKYSRYQDDDSLRTISRINNNNNNTNNDKAKISRTFRGSYKYSRAEVRMAVLGKTVNSLLRRSTFALLGAFLIHVTLGTVYTLSNVNSYMTSYMRKHGSPNATYGAAVWLSSSYSVGQGISMVLGGYLEKRFSARLSCILGCAIHSISIMCTSWTINYGILAVLISYGILPGFGCGLAYMTPMSNGFAWYPNRRGLVAGVILAGFGIGTFVFNMAQTGFVNPSNLSPRSIDNGYFTQDDVLDRVPHLFTFLGCIYAMMQFVGCSLLFAPPHNFVSDERPIFGDHTELDIKSAIKTSEFKVLFVVYGLTTQGVLFINSILKEYGQIYIRDDSYLAWVGSMASIANSLGRLVWGLAIDKYSFTFCFISITTIFGTGLFLTPFEFILSSKLLYLLCTLVMFGSFSGWMSSYPVHLSRVFGRTNSGMIYGLIYISQAVGGILTAFGTHYLIDNYNRFVPFYCICSLELLGLLIYLIFYPKYNH